MREAEALLLLALAAVASLLPLALSINNSFNDVWHRSCFLERNSPIRVCAFYQVRQSRHLV
jgi:hypothetical protein